VEKIWKGPSENRKLPGRKKKKGGKGWLVADHQKGGSSLSQIRNFLLPEKKVSRTK